MAISKLNLDWVDIMILHPPGSGGDMFRTLLMMAITPNKYELGEFNYYGNKTGLLVDGKGLVWIDDVGHAYGQIAGGGRVARQGENHRKISRQGL